MAKKDTGRPTVMTPETISKLEEAFEWGCSDLEACLHANISKSALYEYQQDHPEFTERKEILKKTPTLRARRTVIKEVATDGDLALKYLERKEKDEFSSKSEINTNLTFTQMPAISVIGDPEALKTGLPDKVQPVKLVFNIGD